jgi:polyhydroxyalkanoate synthesis regulator phasin
MAKDVHQTLSDICSEHGEMSPEEAKSFVEDVMISLGPVMAQRKFMFNI